MTDGNVPIKLLIMDVDGTLAKVNRPILPSTLELLKQLQAHGIRLALSSGKPTAYLMGFVRQTGLSDVIITGENGAMTFSSGGHLPEWDIVIRSTDEVFQLRLDFIKLVNEKFGDRIWLQPNHANVAVFWRSEDIKEDVYQTVLSFCKIESAHNLKTYRHVDCVDLLFSHADKGMSLDMLMSKLNLSKNEVAAIGDSENDGPMLRHAGLSLGINCALADHDFINIDEALFWLLSNIDE